MPAESGLCPKQMTHGPCGGVGLDGGCEIDAALPCPFVPLVPVPWSGRAIPDAVAQPGASAMRELMATRPIVVVDLPAAALSASSIRACAELLRGSCDAVLAGDSGEALWRTLTIGDLRVRLVEYSPGYVADHWCDQIGRAHV